MRIWKILLWTSPLWMLAECATIASLSNHYSIPAPPNSPQFFDKRDYCTLVEGICSEHPINEQGFVETEKEQIQSSQWQLPEGVLVDDEIEYVYFDFEGNFLGTMPHHIDFEAEYVDLEQVLLRDGQEWFQNNAPTSIEQWRVEKNGLGYFEFRDNGYFVVRSDRKVGVLLPWGGWVVEPTDEFDLHVSEFGFCGFWTVHHPAKTEIINADDGSVIVLEIPTKAIEKLDCKGSKVAMTIDGTDYKFSLSDFKPIDGNEPEFRDPRIAKELVQFWKQPANPSPKEQPVMNLPENMELLDIDTFSEGLAIIEIKSNRTQYAGEGKFGYVDEKGKLAIYPLFEAAKPFEEGVAVVKYCFAYLDCGYGIIDKTGQWLVSPKSLNFHPQGIYIDSQFRIRMKM